MRRLAQWMVLMVCMLAGGSVQAGGGPQNVALVVNADSWASLAVANEYIRLRAIPARNVIYLDHMPNVETIDVNTFRDLMLKPVLKTLEDRHLTAQIDYVVYSADFPTAVNTNPDKSDAKLPNIITRTASITGLTYLHERVLEKNIDYLGLTVNRYMRWSKTPDDKPMNDDEMKRYAGTFELMDPKANKYADAIPVLEELRKAHPKNFELLYNLSCCLAKTGENDKAMAVLLESVECGWFDSYHTREDDDLASLREREDFKNLLSKLEKTVIETSAPLAFHSTDAWTEKCELAADGKGDRYLLSTMLAVTSGRGTSVREAISYLGRAVGADGTKPAGTIYYLINGDVRATTRRWAFNSAAGQLQKLGVKAEVLNGILPPKKADVMGAMVGFADFNWPSAGSTILPGAICEHLTSFGGIFTQYAGQTPCSEFLRYGAAGTSGAVTEPFALQQKFPTPFIHVFYAQGCSLAESYFQSVSGPYQLIVVGDPLCAPWSHAPKVTLEGITAGQIVKGTLALKPSAVPQPSSFELFVDGAKHSAIKPGESFSLDTTSFGDGHHVIAVVAFSTDRIACQGRAAQTITVNNHDRSVIVEAKATRATWDQTVQLSAKMKGAAAIDLYSNGRLLGRIKGENGSLDVEAYKLGLGTVSVQAHGFLDDAAAAVAFSKPLEIVIDPAWLPGVEKDAAADQSGVLVTLDDKTSKVVNPSRDDKWLAAAGLAKGHTCAVDAWFSAPADEIYQFQMQTPMVVSIEVDGKKLRVEATKAWQFVPVALQKGAHRIHLAADATNAEPHLDLRFGASGTHSIEGNQFQCAAVKK